MNPQTRADRAALLAAHRERGDEAARQQLIDELTPLARGLARRYAGRGEPVEDLEQVAMVGLMNAIDRFDLGRNVDIASFAVPTILGEIKHHFRDSSWTVHVPRGLKERSARLAKRLDALTSQLGRSPSIAELATAEKLLEEEVVEALDAGLVYNARSLDSAPPGAGSDLGAIASFGAPDDELAAVEDRAMLDDGFRELDARELRVVNLRFVDGLTQTRIAEELGISQMHVSRLLRQGLEKMRSALDEETP